MQPSSMAAGGQSSSFNQQPSMSLSSKTSNKPTAQMISNGLTSLAQNNSINCQQSMHSSTKSSSKPPAQKKRKVSESPHVLLWICTHGKGQSRDWTRSALKVVGVYATKDDAQRKKDDLMNQYDNCGHGDILVGGTWSDEIDLVIRPAEEVCL